MSEHPEFYLENGELVWKGEGKPPLETKIFVKSTDRAGQTINRELVLLLETSAQNDVQIYPNPANSIENIHFRLAKSSQVTIRIFDVKGRQVFVETSNQEASFTRTLEINGYSADLYHVIIQIDHHFISKPLLKNQWN
ncbi:MAG: T9SS type A sorting domain-containing protein [Cyclobacteriaceae bacterium]